MSKTKGVGRTVRRISEMVELDDQQQLLVEAMLQSVVDNRDKRIRHLETKARTGEYSFAPTKRKIVGALRSTINAHGPITPENIESASKRILGQITEVSEDEDVSR